MWRKGLAKAEELSVIQLARWNGDDPLDAGSDEYDAALCAVMAAAFAADGEMPDQLPPMAGPSSACAADAKVEGWIYYPSPGWLGIQQQAANSPSNRAAGKRGA
jgi:hypothetical protein